MIYDLPRTVEFGGRVWGIRTDFRDVLNVLEAFEDPELTDGEKAYVCLRNLYEDYEAIPREQLQAAYDAIVAFIDHDSGERQNGPRTMDWRQDAPLIFPAVNRVAGCEVRSAEYLHWWTFLGLFLEIRDSMYSTVLSLRQKRARGKKLEKWEQEFWNQNLRLCRIRERLTEAEQDEKARLEALLG